MDIYGIILTVSTCIRNSMVSPVQFGKNMHDGVFQRLSKLHECNLKSLKNSCMSVCFFQIAREIIYYLTNR